MFKIQHQFKNKRVAKIGPPRTGLARVLVHLNEYWKVGTLLFLFSILSLHFSSLHFLYLVTFPFFPFHPISSPSFPFTFFAFLYLIFFFLSFPFHSSPILSLVLSYPSLPIPSHPLLSFFHFPLLFSSSSTSSFSFFSFLHFLVLNYRVLLSSPFINLFYLFLHSLFPSSCHLSSFFLPFLYLSSSFTPFPLY